MFYFICFNSAYAGFEFFSFSIFIPSELGIEVVRLHVYSYWEWAITIKFYDYRRLSDI